MLFQVFTCPNVVFLFSRRIVPANRVETQRTTPVAGSNLVSTSSRQQHNQLAQHQHLPSHSSSNTSTNSSSHTSSQPQTTHTSNPNPSHTRAVSLPLTSSTSASQGNTNSYSKPLHHTLSRNMSRKEQIKK